MNFHQGLNFCNSKNTRHYPLPPIVLYTVQQPYNAYRGGWGNSSKEYHVHEVLFRWWKTVKRSEMWGTNRIISKTINIVKCSLENFQQVLIFYWILVWIEVMGMVSTTDCRLLLWPGGGMGGMIRKQRGIGDDNDRCPAKWQKLIIWQWYGEWKSFLRLFSHPYHKL